jgi:hypothetical protein
MLDRFVAAALSKNEEASLHLHLQGCELCTRRIASFRSGFDAFPEVDERKLLSAIRQRLHEGDEAHPGAAATSGEVRKGAWYSRIVGWLSRPRYIALYTSALAVAVLGVVLLHPLSPPVTRQGSLSDSPPEASGLRAKGSLGLHVYRQRAERTEEMSSGDRFHAGDHLRFAVDLPKAEYVSIWGIDGRGELYAAWPLPPLPSAGEAVQPDTQRPAGQAQQLPGAVTLDDSPGEESLYLVACPLKASLVACVSRGVGRPPICPAGCSLTQFRLKKD